MKDWRSLPLINALKKGSGIRFGILEVLEENSEGFPVMSIYRRLRERGFNITQPAVSQNLAVLEKNRDVWKTSRFDQEAKRELWYYISAASFYHSVSEDIRKEITLALSKALEKNAEQAPQFETSKVQNLRILLEKIIQIASESLIPSDELYSELSKTKPYGKIATVLRDYKTTIANILEAIKTTPIVHGFSARRIYLHLPGSEALSHPYDIAKTIVDGAIRGEKRYLEAITFLHKNTTGELRERLDKSIMWIKRCSDFFPNAGSELKKSDEEEKGKNGFE